MPRILVIVPAPVSGQQLELRKAQVAVAALPDDVEVDFRAVRASADNQVSYHDYALSEICILEAGLTAEEEGYDAVCVDTVSDSGVNTLRSMLNIPVVGPGRTAYLVALMLSNRFSVVTMWDKWKPLVKKTLTDLQMLDRCASIRAIGMEPNTRSLLDGKEDETFAKMLETSRQCIVPAMYRRGWRRGDLPGFDDHARRGRIPEIEARGSSDQPGTAVLSGC